MKINLFFENFLLPPFCGKSAVFYDEIGKLLFTFNASCVTMYSVKIGYSGSVCGYFSEKIHYSPLSYPFFAGFGLYFPQGRVKTNPDRAGTPVP